MSYVSSNGDRHGAALAALSTGLVQLYARHCGKGPTRAKSYITDDALICVMRDPFTGAERTLIDGGKFETVERMRDGFQEAMEEESEQVLEANFGRHSRAHLRTLNVDPDLAVEIFLLERELDGSPHLNGSGPLSSDGAGPE
jgi:uncharacterized protein YbcI